MREGTGFYDAPRAAELHALFLQKEGRFGLSSLVIAFQSPPFWDTG